MDSLISLRDVGKTHGRSRFSLDLMPGDHYAVLGRENSGKTAVLEMLAGVRTPLQGTYVPPPTGVSIAWPRIQRGWQRTSLQSIAAQTHKKGGLENVSEALSLLGLWEVRKKPFSSLSDTQKRYCALLPVLLGDADIALIDEALDRMDAWMACGVIRLLKLQKAASVIATNSPFLAEEVGSLLLMKSGTLAFAGSISELIEHSGLVRTEIEQSDGSSASALVDPLRLDVRRAEQITRLEVEASQDSAVALLLRGYGSIRATLTRTPTVFEAIDQL